MYELLKNHSLVFQGSVYAKGLKRKWLEIVESTLEDD